MRPAIPGRPHQLESRRSPARTHNTREPAGRRIALLAGHAPRRLTPVHTTDSQPTRRGVRQAPGAINRYVIKAGVKGAGGRLASSLIALSCPCLTRDPVLLARGAVPEQRDVARRRRHILARSLGRGRKKLTNSLPRAGFLAGPTSLMVRAAGHTVLALQAAQSGTERKTRMSITRSLRSLAVALLAAGLVLPAAASAHGRPGGTGKHDSVHHASVQGRHSGGHRRHAAPHAAATPEAEAEATTTPVAVATPEAEATTTPTP
jgi:hypothetical protein